VAPGTLGNVLTSDGTTWVSQAGGGGGGGAGTITRTDFTATAGQTVFTVSYPVGLIDVYRNGVKLATADFTATNGTSFTLATAANLGDIVQAEVFNSLNLYETITADTFSGNGVQTTFIMSVAPASPASTLVAISGVVQNPSNYTVSSTSLTFLTAPPSGTNNISARYLGVPAAGVVQTNIANTFTALQTFAGSSSVADLKTSNIIETVTVSATAATGTINYDITTQSVLYYTSNASANWTVNFRGSSGTSLNTVMATGESMSATFMVTQGATPYFNNALQVDGSSVTPRWQGGTAPTSGNASSIDVYTYVIIKTGNAAFTVLASQTQFK
jgi:hypothetical protein